MSETKERFKLLLAKQVKTTLIVQETFWQQQRFILAGRMYGLLTKCEVKMAGY